MALHKLDGVGAPGEPARLNECMNETADPIFLPLCPIAWDVSRSYGTVRWTTCCCGICGNTCSFGDYCSCGSTFCCGVLGSACGLNPWALWIRPMLLCITGTLSCGRECGFGVDCCQCNGFFCGTQSVFASVCGQACGCRKVDGR